MNEELNLFYEDSLEQLQYMESALLDSLDGTADLEKIGEIFRAMHTIKGTAGMFSFDDVVSFTHIAENLLDKIRAQEIDFTKELVSLFIRVKDITQIMVDDLVENGSINKLVKADAEKIKQELRQYLKTDNEVFEKEESADKKQEHHNMTSWHISLRFDKNFFSSGMDAISLLKYFKNLGKIVKNVAIIDAIPSLDAIQVSEVFIGFELDFMSDCTKEDIEEIFEFVEDDVEIYIFEKENLKAWEELFTRYSDKLKQQLIDAHSYVPVLVEQKEKMDAFTPEKTEQKVAVEQKSELKKRNFSLKVDSSKVDYLINKISEMVIKNAQIAGYASYKEDEDLEEMSLEMSSLLEEVRDGVMNIRMVQVKESFVKYRRIVNDTAIKLGKKIDFVIEGEDTELDKSVIEKLSDPLTHMIRNSIDHGIESPSTREKKGKTPIGKVFLRAYPDAGSILIELEDNGAGINKAAVEKKAIENGLIDANHNLNNKDIYKLIFAAGLSTANEVSSLSGRGVGMDVVRRNIEELRGTIDVDSTENVGSKITIRIPLTLAIIDGFLVQSGHTKYIIPLEMIVECIEYTEEYISKTKGAKTINLRGEVVPLLHIREFFDDRLGSEELGDNDNNIRENIVVVRYGTTSVGLLVDELFGEQQTVIKSLGSIFEKIPGISGGSILGSGEVALIFDIPKLVEFRIQNKRKAS